MESNLGAIRNRERSIDDFVLLLECIQQSLHQSWFHHPCRSRCRRDRHVLVLCLLGNVPRSVWAQLVNVNRGIWRTFRDSPAFPSLACNFGFPRCSHPCESRSCSRRSNGARCIPVPTCCASFRQKSPLHTISTGTTETWPVRVHRRRRWRGNGHWLCRPIPMLCYESLLYVICLRFQHVRVIVGLGLWLRLKLNMRSCRSLMGTHVLNVVCRLSGIRITILASGAAVRVERTSTRVRLWCREGCCR